MRTLSGVWVEKPFSAYRGDGPYVFVCYAHEDSEAVFREIAWLNDYGVNVWYDEGISPGHEWREELAAAIQGCSRMLFFVSPRSVVSEHCRRELNFAQEENREVIAIHLEPTEMPAGLRLGLNNRQAVINHELSEEEFHKRLMRAAQGGSGVPISTSAAANASPRHRHRLVSTATAVIVLAIGVWWLVSQYKDSADISPNGLSAVDEPPAQEVLRNSIAVLPFDNLSPDPEDAYFAAGIHEETLNQLAKINDLSVIARTSVMQYAGVHRPIAEIADELNVRTVIEGSVRYAGNRVRITAQLIDATSGAHLWSEAFEDDLEDIFGIQLAIATRIAEALEAEFSPAERQRVGNRTTDSPEAYAHYLRAVSSYGSFRASQPVHEALDAALALDPDFDTALAFKAFVYGAEGTAPELVNVPAYNAETVRRARALADDYARRALALNPEEGRAFHAMSLAQFGRREWQAALESAERAYTLSPNDHLVAFWMGRLLALAGDEEEGIALQRRALELNPNDMAAVWALGVTYQELGRWREALDQYRVVAAIAPDVVTPQASLAQSSYFAGDLQTTRDIAARFESQGESIDSLIASAGLYGLLGDAKAARRVFDLVAAHPKYDTLDPGLKFGLYSTVKDGERAIGYLERMVDGNFPGYVVLLHFHPDAYMFDAVRSNPKFDELVQRMAKPVDG